MSASPEESARIQYALVCLKTGTVLEVLADEEISVRTEGLAAAASELVSSGPAPDWAVLFGRMGSNEVNDAFREVILISPDHVHIIERLRGRPDVALVAVSLGGGNLGEVLSGIHNELARVQAT